ncbi:MAG: DUF1801 domain-containing protein [Sphingobacteriales bacterium]|nr:MAG: DUF1801 domain-containing protein [Sphingobacteriales bacterium]
MAKAEIKTQQTGASVTDFINTVADEQKRADCFAIAAMMQKATGDEPKMWGPAIIGFGHTTYKSGRSGREVDWMKIGFSPRKANISLYLTMNVEEHAATLEKLGKHKTGVGCIYINKLADVDEKVLKGLINTAAKRK